MIFFRLLRRRACAPHRSLRAFLPRGLSALEARALLSAGLAFASHTPAGEVGRMEAERPEAIAEEYVRIVRDVVYRDVPGDRETLDLYLPTGPTPMEGRPVILAIHGGGWRKFHKEDYAPTVAPF